MEEKVRVFNPECLDDIEVIFFKLAQTNQFVNSWVVMELLYRLQDLKAKPTNDFKPERIN